MFITVAVKTCKSQNTTSTSFIPRIFSAFQNFTREVTMAILCCSNSFKYKSNWWSSRYIAGSFDVAAARKFLTALSVFIVTRKHFFVFILCPSLYAQVVFIFEQAYSFCSHWRSSSEVNFFADLIVLSAKILFITRI